MPAFKVIVNVTGPGLNQTRRRTFDEKPSKSDVQALVDTCFARFGGLEAEKPKKKAKSAKK